MAKISIISIQNLKEKLCFLCSCTALEIITAIGVTGYLFYTEDIVLSLISLVVFGKLIIFHFIMDYFDKHNQKHVGSLV